MVLGLVIVGLILIACVWVSYLATRTPRKPEHERAPERFRDPTLTSHRSGQGG